MYINDVVQIESWKYAADTPNVDPCSVFPVSALACVFPELSINDDRQFKRDAHDIVSM
jgi:hypothetical protein